METETGITYYELDKGMDTGKIIYQSKFKLQGNEDLTIFIQGVV